MTQPRSPTLVRLALAAAIAVALSAGAARAEVTLTHVHGLAWSSDGARLYVPSHHGLAIYAAVAGKWSKGAGPEHDYMGFSATRERFYSSGHPAPGSGLTNPFGLVRSDDAGATWRKLGLEGEADFHLLATGFASNAVYVIAHGPNSRMASGGLHHTQDDGLTWKKAAARGLVGEPLALAVHPADPQVVAVGTRAGLFVSTDAGDTFRRLTTGQALSMLFDLDGERLWFAGHDGAPTLQRTRWRGGAVERIALPSLTDDAVAYIAQNPARRSEYAIATFQRNVFLSLDGGAPWQPIARQGRGIDR